MQDVTARHIPSTDLRNAFYLYYWVWQRSTPLPQVAERLKLSRSKARTLLTDFNAACVSDPKLYSLYQTWKLTQEGKESLPRPIYEHIKSKLREIDALLSQAQPIEDI